LKAHHFTLAETNKDGGAKNYFGTVNKDQYNFKGDPSKIRGVMA